MIKITDVEGFRLCYDSSEKKFMLINDAGERVASDVSQEELEKKAKALRKEEFQRIPILKMPPDGRASTGEITSVNIDDSTMWVVLTRQLSHGGGKQERSKESLRYGNFCYEHTEHNLTIAEKIRAQHELIGAAEAESERLRNQLEKPINSAYFGIKR